jgi:ABC-type polar amino acid transport system ATPase subunit
MLIGHFSHLQNRYQANILVEKSEMEFAKKVLDRFYVFDEGNHWDYMFIMTDEG